MQSPSFPEDYRKKFWKVMETQTGIYANHLPTEQFCYTFNTTTNCVEVWNYHSFDRYFLKKNDFEKHWDSCDSRDYLDSLEKLEGKMRFVWLISKTILH